MTSQDEGPRVASATREIAAGSATIFELIADPAQQPRWDGNDNLAEAAAGQRVQRTGDVFLMTTTRGGQVRENHVVEFDEGRRPSRGKSRQGICGAGNWRRSTRRAHVSPTPTTGPT